MDIGKINFILEKIGELSTMEYIKFKETLKDIDHQRVIQLTLENSKKELKCPFCAHKHIWRWGHRNGLQRYKCKNCHKTFNSLTSTPLQRLRNKNRWLEYTLCLKEGVSVRKAAQSCHINKNTSFLWRHRFLSNSRKIKPTLLNGIVEADETYFLRSEKGCKNLTRPPRKRGGKARKRGLSSEQVCVFVSRDRSKNTFDLIFRKFNSSNLKHSFGPHLSRDALFCSDGSSVYKKFTRENQIRHGCLNIRANIRVKKQIVHIQNVNSYHSRLKKWMSRFNGVATKYLDSYLGWYRGLDEFNGKITPAILLLRGKVVTPYKLHP